LLADSADGLVITHASLVKREVWPQGAPGAASSTRNPDQAELKMEVSDVESSADTFTRTLAQRVEQTPSVDGGGAMKRRAGASAAVGAKPAAPRRRVETQEPAGSVASSTGLEPPTLQQWIRRPNDEIQDRDHEIERLHRQVSEYQELLKECKQQLNEAKREIKEMHAKAVHGGACLPDPACQEQLGAQKSERAEGKEPDARQGCSANVAHAVSKP